MLKCQGNQYHTVKLCTVIDGKFLFRDTLSHTQHYGIKGRGYDFPFLSEIWVAPGSYTSITGKGYNSQLWEFDNEVPEQQLENSLLQATKADWEIVGKERIKEYQWILYGNKHRGNDSILQLARQSIHTLWEKTDPLMEQIVVKAIKLVNQHPVSSW